MLLLENARFQIILAFIVIFLFYRLTITLLHNHRQKQKAHQWNCQPIPTEPSTLPLGLDILYAVYTAAREYRLPDYLVTRFQAMNRYSFVTNILGKSTILTADPQNIQAMLATQFADFKMSQIREHNFKLFLGRSIFTVDDGEWHAAREMVRPIFSREMVSDLGLLERHLRTMWDCMPTEGEGGWTGVVSLGELFPFLTLDSATELFLGKSPESLKVKKEGRLGERGFHWAFERIEAGLAMRIRLQGLAFLYSTKELKECNKILNEFTARAIQEAESRQKDSSERKYDYLSILRSRSSSVDEIREHVLGLLAAGRDTTANLLSWTFYTLLRHPEVLSKLRQIIMDIFPNNKPEEITFEKLKSCRYLQFVMNETLRLHPIVPMNSRAAKVDTTLPVGGGVDGKGKVFIEAGREVRFCMQMLHRRKDLWGEDAEVFKPERWEKARPGWAFVPFNGGPRLCIGQQFALTEAGYVIVRMLQRFDRIEGVDVDLSRDYHTYGMTCAPGPGHDAVKVRMRVAEGAL